MPLITKTDSTGAVNGGAISSITKKIKGPCDEDEEQAKKKDSLTIDKSRGPLKRDLTLDSKKSSKSGKGTLIHGPAVRTLSGHGQSVCGIRYAAYGYSFWFGPFIHLKGSDKNDDFFEEMPKSIIPTKGQRGPEIEKFYEDFDLKYTSGRRYCGIYIPTMNTAFDPKSGTLSN